MWQAPGAVFLHQNAGAYVAEVLHKFSRSYANVGECTEYSFADQVFLAVPLWLSCVHQSLPRYVLFHVGLEYTSMSFRPFRRRIFSPLASLVFQLINGLVTRIWEVIFCPAYFSVFSVGCGEEAWSSELIDSGLAGSAPRHKIVLLS